MSNSGLQSPLSRLRGKVALVGGGLAGSLLAIYLARRGYGVDVYERRPDMRKEHISAGRSINLALSVRGIHALKGAGLVDQIMKIAIPMKGRMIHLPDGSTSFQRYGKDDSEAIYAVSRGLLNMALLDAAEREAGVTIHFRQRCTGMDFGAGGLHLQNEQTGERKVVNASPVIGTDGSASAIRLDMQKAKGADFSQEQLEYGYKELVVPPGTDGNFRMDPSALHIWPRTTFMLIALPNTDKSFTCTFFYPLEGEQSFKSLTTEDAVQKFFTAQFPDAVSLMPTVVEDFFYNPTGTMVTVKCSSWHIGGTAALLGDAAHAIVPFFGQGMNCAFEDCTVLDGIIGGRKQEAGDVEGWWSSVFAEYEQLRKVNADAIADLAVENFVEMRDLVATPKFQLKKKIEQRLQAEFPDIFIPKYSMVTFHRLPYSIALQRGKIQDRILEELSSDAVLSMEKARLLIDQHLKHIPLPEEA